jgi:EAL domain-containing protein (putative c-di-GMP-specific phosphodiesterase class I)
MGCSFAQGFYYSRPVAAAAITAMIQHGRFSTVRVA